MVSLPTETRSNRTRRAECSGPGRLAALGAFCIKLEMRQIPALSDASAHVSALLSHRVAASRPDLQVQGCPHYRLDAGPQEVQHFATHQAPIAASSVYGGLRR
jgi:hypothetical protein